MRAAALGQPVADLVPFDAHAAGEQQIDELPVVLVDAHARVVGGDDGIGPDPVDGLVADHMGGEQIVDGDGRVPEPQQASRREHPEGPAPDGQHVDLIDGDPVPHHGRELPDSQLGPAPEAVSRIRPEPEVVAKPGRMGEVVEGDQRLEATVEAGPDDGGVPGQCRPVHTVGIGYHPGPLHTQPEAVAPQAGGTVERLLRPVPEADGVARGLDPTHLLPGQPVVGHLSRTVVTTLDLEPGRGHAEEEVLGEPAVGTGALGTGALGTGALGTGARRWLTIRGQRPHLSQCESSRHPVRDLPAPGASLPGTFRRGRRSYRVAHPRRAVPVGWDGSLRPEPSVPTSIR